MPVLGLGRGESLTHGARLTCEQTWERLLQQHSRGKGLWWGNGADMGQGKCYENLPFWNLSMDLEA